MRRALLLYNPASGRHHNQRLRTIEQVAQVLRNQGLEVLTSPTEAPGTAGHQASQACAAGIEIVFACGGDGTIHEVIQGLAFRPQTALGIIPLGTANALARHLRLSLDPVQAALQQLDFLPKTVPLGKVTYQTPAGENSRYFIVMAGAGTDGALVYNMLATGKHRLGRIMYYLRAAILFSHHRFQPFSVNATSAHLDTTQSAISAMCVRVADLGGLFSPLIRNASIEDPHLTVSITEGPAHVSLPAWFAFSWVRLHRWNQYTRTSEVDSFHCSTAGPNPIQVQADGEHLGTIPMSASLIPNAIQLLMQPL